MGEVVDIDTQRRLQDIVKRDLGSSDFVFAVILEDGTTISYFPDEIEDMKLSYLIETLSERIRKQNINE